MKISSALLLASATATSLVANDFAEEEQNFVKLAEGMTEVAEEKTEVEQAPEIVAEATQQLA
jgi:thiamine pyrophosphate-dependent acetolactate synthase large subunit-like protein